LLDSIEKPERSNAVHFRCIFGYLKRNLHMALRAEVIYFIGRNLLQKPVEIGGIGQIAIMKLKTPFQTFIVIQMVDSMRVKGARAPDHTMHDVSFSQQLLG